MWMASNTQYAGSDLSNQDLRGKDFTHCVMFQTDLRGSSLHGASITLDCATFDGVKLDTRQVAMLLALIAQAETTPATKAALQRVAQEVYGRQMPPLQAMLALIE